MLPETRRQFKMSANLRGVVNSLVIDDLAVVAAAAVAIVVKYLYRIGPGVLFVKEQHAKPSVRTRTKRGQTALCSKRLEIVTEDRKPCLCCRP